MKKYTILILLFSFSLLIVASDMEIKEVTTKYGVIEIKIPKDYETLRDYYIELAAMYHESDTELDIMIDKSKELIEQNEKLQKDIEVLTKQLEKTQELLDNIPSNNFLNQINIYGSIKYDGTYAYGLSYNILLYQKFQVGFKIDYPLMLGVYFGITW